MQRAGDFHGNIDGHIVIPGQYTAAGGTTNFNFGSVQDPASQEHKAFSTVPFAPDPDFVDRPEILAWIRDKCDRQGARAALVGLGGVGKSQLAIRYSHDICDAAPHTFVFWVHASTRARFEEAYSAIADRLELPGRNDPKVDVLRLVSNWLCDKIDRRWMMILDNADDIEIFYPTSALERDETLAKASAPLTAYLPQSRNGSILITSRSKDAAARLAGGHNNIKEVCAMNESQALDLFRNKLQIASNEEGAADLLRTLDYIPLPITQAAAFINRRGRITASNYLDDFRRSDKKKENLLNWDRGDLRRDESASNSVVLTWQMSFERIREQRRSAADLLSLMSFFSPQGIPEWILRRQSKSEAKTGDEHEIDSAFDEDLDTLQAYSLITVTADSDICEMHALVQFCTRVWLSTFSDAERWRQKFIRLMAHEFPMGNFENWAKCQQLLPHIESLYDKEPTSEEPANDWVRVLTTAAVYMYTKGMYVAAQEAVVKALTVRERVVGQDDELTLMSVGVLASVLQGQGKYNEAEKLNRRALKGREKELGEQHPDTLASINNLALTLKYQGKHDEAEKLNRRALEGMEKVLGEQHPTTLTSINNLGNVLHYQGKYNEAEKLYRRTLKGMEKELGEQHPDTLASINNLALTLQYQGKYDEAEKLYRRALEGKEKVLGEQHPTTLASVYNLACLLYRRNQYQEASEFYQRAYDGYKQKLGAQHRTTIACQDHFSAIQKKASMNSRGTTSKPASNEQKSKQCSLYTRLKRRIRKEDV